MGARRTKQPMIAISSHRPFANNSEYAANQERAAQSLQAQFNVSNIYYVGHYEDGLNSEKTMFIRPEGTHPTIKSMADFASKLSAEYVAILNADIVLGSAIAEVEKRMHDMALPAATSYRYEFDPEDYPNLDGAVHHHEVRGMDIFIANPGIWKLVAKDIPETLWFGHQTFDSWLCGYFCHHLGYGFRQFTDMRCVFHPKHGGRLTPFSPQIKNDSPYFTRAKRPSPL